jgi:ABC-2 type transport system ATP-binding protein
MQKQAAFILVLSQMPDYLLLDEPIDGLDPLVRKRIWKYIMDDVAERETTVLISSHHLKEIENACDHIGIITNGSMAIERELDMLKSDIHKLQVAWHEVPENPYVGLNILHKETRGSVELLVIRNKREDIAQVIKKSNPALFDLLPLTLEEIFIYELGGQENENILF